MNESMSKTMKKALSSLVAIIVALSLVFLQWPISSRAVADAVEGAQERMTTSTSIDVPLAFEHAYITYNGQVIAEPATKVTLPTGSDLEFTATPDSGYQVESVIATIDGTDTKVAPDKDKKYKLTASEVALTSKIRVCAITAPTVEDSKVEVAQEAPAASEPEQEPVAEAALEAASADETAEAPAVVEAPAAAEAPAAVEVAEVSVASLQDVAAVSAVSAVAAAAVAEPDAVTPITDSNATVTIGIYPTEQDRSKRTNPLTSDYEISVAETLYGAVHFDFNPGAGPKTGRLTYSYKMPDNIKTEDKPVSTLYDDAGNRAGTWEISGNTVYFYYDESWALAHPNGGGNFNFDFTLDEEQTETGSENTFSFPGATGTVTVRVKDAEITGSKSNAGVEEGGYVSYTVKLHAQKDFSSFVFSDHLESSLDYVEGSFQLDGQPLAVTITENADGTHDASAAVRSIAVGDHVITYRTKIDQTAYEAMNNWEVLNNTRNTAKWDYSDGGEWKHGSSDSWLWVQKNILNKWQSGGLWQGNMVKWTVQVNGSDQYKADLGGYTVTDTLQSGMTYWNHFNVLDSNWKFLREVPIPEGATSFTYTFPEDAGAKTYYIEYYTIIKDVDAIKQSTTFQNKAEITPPGGGTPTGSTGNYTYNPGTGTGTGTGTGDEGTKPAPDVTKEVIDQSKALASGIVSWHSTLVSDVYPEPEQTSGLVLQYYDTLDTWANRGDIQNKNERYFKIWFVGEPQLYANNVKLVKGVDYQFDEQGGRTYGYTSYGENFEGEKVPTAFRIRFILDTPLMSDVVANKTPIDIYYDTKCDGTFQTYYNEGRARITSGNTEVYGKSVKAEYDLVGESSVTKTGWMWFDEERGKYVAQWEVIANRADNWDCRTSLPSPVITIADTLPEGMKVIEDSIDLWVVRPESSGLKYISVNPDYTFQQNGNVATFTTDLTKAKLQDWQEPFYDEAAGTCYAWAQLRFRTELDPASVVHDGDAQTLRNTVTAKAGDLPLGTGHAAVSYTDSVISKTGYQNDGEPVVHYTIKVNEKAQKLDPDATHTQINLKDTLDYRSTVVPSSIKVMEGDKDITGECAVTLSNGEHDGSDIATSSFTVKVPDGRSLVITYDVKLSGTEGQWFEVTNSATLNGITNKQTQSKQWFKVNHADASVYGSNTAISIVKMDSENIVDADARLAGAVFELYSVDMGKLPSGPVTPEGLAAASTLVNTVETNGEGEAFLIDEYTKAIQYDTLYYFKEVKAPEGYQIDDPDPHFVMTQGDNFYAQNAIAESHGIHPSPNTAYNVTDTPTSKVPEKIDIAGVKAWDDAGNQDGLRPASVTVRLLANGSETGQTATATAEGGWTFAFTDLDETDADGEAIAYSVEEDAIGGYAATVSGSMAEGFAITNRHTPETTQVAVRKSWEDAGNRDGLRPSEVYVQLYADGVAVEGKKAGLSEANGWSDMFTDLPKYADGHEIAYTVEEITEVAGYENAVTGSAAEGFTVTNRHAPETTAVSGVKSWHDGGNADGNRPKSVTVHLLADGVEIAAAEATEEGGWAYEFTGLPVYKEGAVGQKVSYTVTEGVIADYIASVVSGGLVNTYDRETTSVRVTKSWDDGDDKDGIRPAAVSVQLLANGEVRDTVELSAASGWTYEWGELPKRLNGTDATYTVAELEVAGYELVSTTGNATTGFVLTNKHVPESGDATLTLYKASAVDSEKTLYGAQFTLTDENDPSKVEVVTTDWYGMATFTKLFRGKTYMLQETAAPGGFRLDDKVYHVEVSDSENPTVTCTDGIDVWYDATVGYWASVEDQPDSGYGSIIIQKTLVGSDGVWGNTTKHPEIDTVRQNIWISASNIATGDYFVFQGIGNGAKGTRKVDLFDSAGTKKGQVTVKSEGSMSTRIENLPSGTWWVTEYADGMTSFDGASGAKSGTSDTWTRTTTYEVNGEVTQAIGTSSDSSQVKTIEITNRYLRNGSLVLKKEFGWEHTDLPGGYAGNLLGGKEEGDTGATGQIMANITFTLTGKNTGETYTIKGNKISRTTPTQIISESGDTAISVVYQRQQWTITNLPYDTYTVVESSDGYRDEGEEIDTILHKFYTTGTFDVTKDAATTNVAVGETTGTRGAEGVSETGATVDVNGTDAEMDVLNIYYRPKAVEATKAWTIPEGVDYTPRDIEVQLVRSINGVDNVGQWGQGYYYPVTSADVPEHPGYVTRKTLHWDSSTRSYDKVVFANLPAVTANGEQITYEVREVRADGELVPMANGSYTDKDGAVIPEGSNIYIDADGATAFASWGNGWNIKKNPYTEPDGTQQYYSSTKGLTIANTLETTEVSGVKSWNDANDQDGIRPASVVVRLLANGSEVSRATTTADDGWAYSFENLPRYLNGEEVDYAVEEVAVSGYTAEVSGYDIANTHKTETTSVKATKVWDDGGNRDAKRPASIRLQLMGADGEYGDPVELNEGNGWSYTWENLPLNREGKRIEYRVVELDVPDGYTVAYTGSSEAGLTVTDSYTPGVTSVSVAKAWEDDYDRDRVRPGSVQVQLYAGDDPEGDAVELSEGNGWAYTWSNLPQKAAGVDIAYTVREVAGAWSDDYASELTGSAAEGFTFTNTHETEKVSVSGKKTWVDGENQDGLRPDSVTVRLFADGKEVASTTATAERGWRYEFSNLPKFEAGNEISYTVKEDAVEGYSTAIDGTSITNTHAPAQTSVSVEKAWDDQGDYDGLRPSAVSVQLYADGAEKGAPVTLSEANEWAHTWSELPKFANGVEISYTVAEVDNGNSTAYTTSGPAYDEARGAFVITNKHEVVKVNVHGTKTWSDKDDQDGKRPSSITVNLLRNGGKIAEKEVIPDEAGTWSFEFANLDRYVDGKEAVYTVSEEEVAGYTATISGDAANGFTIDNAYKPETTEISVEKVWDDADDQDGLRPRSIAVRLMNGEQVAGTAVLNEQNNWKHTWEGLDRYAGGELIDYRVVEDGVEGYTSEVSGSATAGFTLKNAHTPGEVDVKVDKVWNDGDDQDGMRPDGVEVQLVATAAGSSVALEGFTTTVTLNDENGWHYEWTGLPEKHAGAVIDYTLSEVAVTPGYTSSVTQTASGATAEANAAIAFTVTNAHTPEKTVVAGAKHWEDGNNQDGLRPSSVTVRLLASGVEVADKVAIVTAENGWTYAFTDLPKYAGGEEIAYTVKEDAVAGYTADIDGYDITNTHEPEKTSVRGTKTWDDANNQDGKRPESITVRVWDGTTEKATVTVKPDASGVWSYEVTGLPKYANGTEVAYTVTEDAVAGYDEPAIDGYTITNKRTPETLDLSGMKTWNDANNQDGIRPQEITVNLFADGTVVRSVPMTAETGWAYSFGKLPKYANGKEITYTVSEEAVSGYASVVNGMNIINTHAPEKTSVSGKKVWNDADNQDGIRPSAITVNLWNGDVKVDSTTATAEGGWTYAFTNLDKFANGEPIVYTVTEEPVAGYEATIDGYAITNTHTPATIDIEGAKVWDDADDQDGKRPESITVHLLANGSKAKSATVTPDADGNWTYAFKNLPKFAKGNEITYTVAEDAVEGYDAPAVEGYTITNKRTPELTSVSGEKIWDDDENRDGKRPASVTVRLLANGAPVADKVATVDEASGWKYAFDNLPKYENGTEIKYSVAEDAVADYEASYDGYDVKNTHAPGKVSVSGVKTWDDGDNQDGLRPESITVRLLANGTEIDHKSVTEADGWRYEFTDLDEFENGTAIAYTVTEDAVAGYEATIDGYNVKNTHTPGTVDLSGVKTWSDANNQDGLRPASVTVRLLADGKEVAHADATEAGGWAYSFTGLPEKKAGKTITYTVTEDAVAGYEADVQGMNITNTHAPAKTKVEGSKSWGDSDNQDGVRPDSVTVLLLADGVEVDRVAVTEADGWAFRFANLDKFANGKEIVYTVDEVAVPGYAKAVAGTTIVNTHETEKTSVSATKVWSDGDNRDAKRPASIHLQLMGADGKYGEPVELNEANGWSYTWRNLPLNRAGERIDYSVVELDVPDGYTVSYGGDAATGFTVTDSYAPGVTNVSVAKAWEDGFDQDGKRPGSVQAQLYANGTAEGEPVTLNEANGWAHTWTDLPQKAAGTDIVYTVAEVAGAWSDDYETSQTGDAANGFTITNKYTPEQTEVAIEKTWDDADDQDGKRPESITVRLLANGEQVRAESVVPDADGAWAYTFENLPKFAAGKEIAYTVAEDAVEGYDEPAVDGFVITNARTPELTSVSGTKTWNDNDDQDGKRPESIMVKLLANGSEVDSKTVSEADGWAYTFDKLPKYAGGTEIAYAVLEGDVDEYTASYDGYDITNTHTPGKTGVSGVKTWDDADNQDGLRPSSVTVHLLANGKEVATKVVTAADDWRYQFTDLDEYEGGSKITYTVTEDAVENYVTTIDGYNVKNAHEPATVDLEGKKTWDDADNQDGLRPASVTVRLLADGEEVAHADVAEADGWAYSFKKLPKFSKGNEIKYTLVEDEVANYEATIAGLNVANTHVPATVDVRGTKTWDDGNNQDGKRPDSVTVRLYADGTEVQTATATKDSGWAYAFENLPKFKNGVEVVYTVSEDEVEGYATELDGYDITNAHTPETTSVSGAKTWDDANNQDGKRPSSITVNLLANGEQVDSRTLIPDEAGVWPTYSFMNLPVYKNGEKIAYTVSEDTVPDYETTVEGYDVTNKHAPATTSVSGKKTWDDADNQDGLRPASVTVNLLANGIQTKSATVTAADNWRYEFTDLPVYEGGKEIAYSVSEEPVTGYEAAVSDYDIENTHAPAQTSVKVVKEWDDENDYDGLRPDSVKVQLYADGTAKGEPATLDEGNGWSFTWTGLDKFSSGNEISYTVAEVDGGSAAYTTTEPAYDEARGAFIITNKHEVVKVSVSGTKTWNDANNQDGKRPESITVDLLANGSKVDSAVVTPDAGGAWAFAFTDLDKYAGGREITYTITEEQVEGYTATISGDAERGFAIINAYEPEKTEVKVAKTWDDADDQDGIRPTEVTVRLMNGDTVVDTAVLNEENGWAASWMDLDRYANGTEIAYTVEEAAVPDYASELAGSMTGGFTLKNTHAPSLVDARVGKAWDDADDQDGKRPDSVDVRLNATVDGVAVVLEGVEMTATLSDGNGWHHEWSGLPQKRGGKAIAYTLDEVGSSDGYTNSVATSSQAAATGATSGVVSFTVTNSHAPELIDIPVRKSWNDAGDQDGIRPAEVVAHLYAGSEPALSAGVPVVAALSESNGWTHTFTGLPKYAGGAEIAYSVVEDVVPSGYEAAVSGTEADGFTITNSHAPETTSASVRKAWNDADDQDGVRPESATVQLVGPNGAYGEPVVLSAANGWAHEWRDLPLNHEGSRAQYSVIELDVADGYTASVSGDAEAGFTVENSYTPGVTSVSVVKVWDDADDQDGARPDSIAVQLYADGVVKGEPVVLNAANGWSYTWSGLWQRSAGKDIAYTVAELGTPEGYATTVAGDAATGFTITNAHAPETTEVSAVKQWRDGDDQDGIRAGSVQVQLYADGVALGDAATLDAGNGWTATWSDLPKRAYGEDIAYTVAEIDAPDGYAASIEGDAAGGFVVANAHVPEVTSVKVSKAWDDADDQDGKRPVEVAVQLLANDGAYGEPVVLSAANGWAHEWRDLPLRHNGTVVDYAVVESSVPDGYTASVAGDRETGFVITNSYTPGVRSVTVSKAWDDAGNQDGKRPDAVKVRLLADGSPVVAEGVASEVELNESNRWAYTWEGLDQMRAGKDIVYTVEEVDVPEGYLATTTGSADAGFVIANAHLPETTSVEVSKAWDDDDNRDGKRPEGIVISLYANGVEVATQTVTPDARGDWSYEFEDLPKYADGAEVAYAIAEKAVAGYSASIDGLVATNAHENEVIEVSGAKIWADNDNQDGRRPASITVNLLADGQQVDSKVVSAAENWEYSFTGLNKYRDGGVEIAYTVSEEPVAGYVSAVDGANLRNTPVTGDLAVSKTVENATRSGQRFTFIVTLDDSMVQGRHGDMTFVDGVATIELADGESAEATGLPAGIRYAVIEEDAPGFTVSSEGAYGTIEANGRATARLTNTYNATGEAEFFAMKNLVGRTLNAEEFSFELLEDGQVIQTAVNAGDGHARFDAITYTIADVGAHAYQIREVAGDASGVEYDAVAHDFTVEVSDAGDGTLAVSYDGYDPSEGAVFTNTYTPTGKVALAAVKRLDGAVPAAGAYEFQLADSSGRVIATARNAADGSVTFPELTFKAAGTYEYTISEVVPADAQKLGGSVVYDGVVYDLSESAVSITAIDNFDGTLRFNVSYDGGTPKTFENEAAPTATFPLEATKAIAGREFRAGDEFTFTVEASEGAPLPERTSATIRPTSGSEASASFGDITFTTADLGNTYTYTLHEERAGETVDGVTYDPFAHTVTLTVIDAGDGTMKVVPEYDRGNGSGADRAVFTNTYAASGEAVLSATKTLSGRALADGEFFFELAGDGLPSALHASAAADGTIAFPAIAYTLDDAGRDFHYTMREVQGTLGGITYDTNEHEVTVHVADNGDGTLAIGCDYGIDAGNANAAPVFENSYQVTPASVELGAHKALVGGSLAGGEFSFELRGVSENAAGAVQTVSNDAAGAVAFAPIEYTAPGTYEYRVSEVVPGGATDNGDGTFTGVDGIVYDGSEHTATVTVVDDGYGKLVATVDYDGGASGISFGNTALVRTGFTFDKYYFGGVGTFDFTMTAVDASGTPRAGDAADYSEAATIVDDGSQAFTATVQNGAFDAEGASKIVFPEIGYVADGDYYYLVDEAESDTPGMIADKAQFLVHVVVRGGEVADTTFELLYDGENLGATDDLAFYNNSAVTLGFNSLKTQAYTRSGMRVSVYPEAKKYLNGGTDQLVGGDFAFELTDEATGSVIATATNDEEGRIAFFEEGDSLGLSYNEPGTYRYLMREVAGDEAGMVYDSSAILLTVSVEETDDGLVATTTYNGPGGGEPAFYNVKRGMDVTVRKVSRFGGEGLVDCTYALWMVGDGGDALIGEAISDEQGYITFKDVSLLAGQKYYFKEVEAPKGHTVDPYRTAYFSLNEAGDALVLAETTAPDGWHSATENKAS